MTDHEHIERRLHDAVTDIRVDTGLPREIHRRIKLRRVGTVATGMVVVAALAFGGSFAAGAFSTDASKVGPADDPPSKGSAQTLYAVFDDERVGLRFETEIDAICNFGSQMFADEAVAKAEIVEGQEARTSVIVFEPNPTAMTVRSEDESIGWCFEGLDRQAMDAVQEAPERYFLLLTYNNGDEAISALRRDNGDGNYATGPYITIAQGRFLGVDWEYYGYESNDGLCLELAIGNNSGGGCGFRARKTSEPVSLSGTSFGASPDGKGIAAVEGRVSDAVERLEIEIRGAAEAIDLVRAPDGLGLKDRVFSHLIDANRLSGNPDVWLVAYGRDDKVLVREQVTGLEHFAPQNRSEGGPTGDFGAIWPEDTAQEANDVCNEAQAIESWRTDAVRTAEEFGRQVLGWEPAALVRHEDGRRIDIELRRSSADDGAEADGPAVMVYMKEIFDDCWSVGSVSRLPDRRPTGVSVGIRGRDVEVGFDDLGADSIYFEMGHGVHTSSADGEVPDGRITWVLNYKPDQTGHFLLLFKDEGGEVFSATGGPLPAGDFAAG